MNPESRFVAIFCCSFIVGVLICDYYFRIRFWLDERKNQPVEEPVDHFGGL